MIHLVISRDIVILFPCTPSPFLPYIPQGSPLFAATYLSDLSLSMARQPSLGVVIGLAHNLAPSTPGRFGGHLRDLTQWKETAFLLFLRLKSYLTQINGERTDGKGDTSTQVRDFLYFSLLFSMISSLFLQFLIIFLNIVPNSFSQMFFLNFF
jgi:hypothetical protein